MKKKSLIILITTLILLGFVSGFVYWFQYLKPTIPSPRPPSVPEPLPISSLCLKFPEIQNEISCEEAASVALEKYSGTVQQIDKRIVTVPLGTPPDNITFREQEAWIIKIDLEEPIQGALTEISTINAIVSLKEKRILNIAKVSM